MFIFCFSGFEDLLPLWQKGIAFSDAFSDLVSESVLLHTFAAIGERTAENRAKKLSAGADPFLRIRKYIDDNFSDPALSLDRISQQFSYNKKYLSATFKRHFGLGPAEYLNTVRIHHACVLIDRNYTGVGDLAFLCGFKDPMYFSKVFKKKMGLSPREYINQKR